MALTAHFSQNSLAYRQAPSTLPSIEAYYSQLEQNTAVGFTNCFENTEALELTKETLKKFQHKKALLHIGVGGSSLGPEFLIRSLSKKNPRVTFLSNIDPDELYLKLENIKLEETLFYVVSKSGSTAETLALLFSTLNHFNLSSQELKNHFVVATDPHKSELRTWAQENEISTLPIPSNLGGRYCVLSPVGFLPLLFERHDLKQLILGAADLKKSLIGQPSHFLYQCLHLVWTCYQQNINETVLMPYSSKLLTLSDWFCQLWAESLGKKLNLNGQEVAVGLTPIRAYGATDQHSLMQLFMEGPPNKLLLMLQVKNFSQDFSLKNSFQLKSMQLYSPHSLSSLMQAEFEGTLKALEDNDRPFIHLSIDRVDEYHLGQLILFFEYLTAGMGHLLNIDPFNQPGVEQGKRNALDWLSRKA